VKAVACLICCAPFLVFGAGFQAGVARVEITPREPIWMSGYASRNHPFTGIRQKRWAKALAIQSGSSRPVVIVATDLVGLPAEVADEVAARAHRQFGIERSRLLLNSSHTHTGPVVWPGLAAMFDLPPGEESKLHVYATRLVDDLVSVIGKSMGSFACGDIVWIRRSRVRDEPARANRQGNQDRREPVRSDRSPGARSPGVDARR
jgi:neutral ceramidase